MFETLLDFFKLMWDVRNINCRFEAVVNGILTLEIFIKNVNAEEVEIKPLFCFFLSDKRGHFLLNRLIKSIEKCFQVLWHFLTLSIKKLIFNLYRSFWHSIETEKKHLFILIWIVNFLLIQYKFVLSINS